MTQKAYSILKFVGRIRNATVVAPFLLSLMLATLIATSHTVLASSAGITGVHGYPTNTAANTCRDAGCHDDAAYSAASVSITLGGDNSVVHGTTSSNMTLNGTGGSRRGFNIAMYRGSTKQTTAWSSLSAGVQELSNELTHTGVQNINDWSFRWTAPATLGTYTLYGCLNPVDNMGTSADDGAAECTTRSVSVTNNNPNAINDPNAITVSEDATTWSSTFNVLSNDLQTDGDAFSWDSTNTAGLSGLLDDNSNGTYRFDPNGQFEGLDTGGSTTTTFTYTIEENSYPGYTDTATVTVTITGVNDAPTAANDGTSTFGFGHVTINEAEVAVNVGNVLSNDSDPDDSMTASRAGPGCAAVSPTESSSFNLNSNGTFNYTHDGIDPVTTQDTFTYCAYDGEAYSAVRTVYIDIMTVNDVPTVVDFDGSIPFTEQTPVVIDNTLTIDDTDNTLINRARLTIAGNYEAGDILTCGSVPAGISCGTGFDVPTRTLTMTGDASWADYETAIGTVLFDNPASENPSLSARTVELDVRDDSLGQSIDYGKTVSVIRTNDPPSLNAIAPQVATENTLADPFTFQVTVVATDPDVDDDINNGMGSLTYSLSGAPAGMTISNTNPTQGEISWDPAITGIFGNVVGPITVLIEDGDEDTSVPNSQSFSITVSPPDGDLDMVANYDDLCLTVASVNPGENLDNDLDGLAGADGQGMIGSAQHDASGGDVCDIDDDNDGITDVDENIFSLDPFDPNDANADNDGDGISNIDEINILGTNPNLANLSIDATGYLTPFDLVAPVPSEIHLDATAVSPSDPGPYRPGDNTITWIASNSLDADLGTSTPLRLVSDPPTQPFDIRPLVNFSADQQAESGMVTVGISINGDSPSWPATAVAVNYTISGTASNPADHDASSGTILFNDMVYSRQITFNVINDGIGDPDETVIFTIDSVTNAAIGSKNTHQVTLIEGNIAPQAEIQFTQGIEVGSAYTGDGNLTISAAATDINTPAQTLTYDWSGTDNSLTNPGNAATWTPFAPVIGNYLIDVLVTDNGTPPRSTRISRILNVSGGNAPAGDADSDGIPDDRDPFDSSGGGDPSNSNLIPDQTVNTNTDVIIETNPGLKISIGNTAQAANSFGVLLTETEIANFGSATGTAPVDPVDSLVHVGGIYDFEITGLIPGSSVDVVIPILSSIPRNAEYRKFNPATGWGSFVLDGNNSVASAPGAPGVCPQPGSSEYRNGLNYLDNCVQLTINDGGPNDTDNAVNGVVTDPGAIGIGLTEPEIFEEVEDGGGRMPPMMLVLLTLIGVVRILRNSKRSQLH